MPSLRTRLFHTWFRLTRPVTLGVRAAVENEAGHVFMVRHTYIKGWHMPGGGVEQGQTAAEALRRELLEEAGVQLIAEPLLISLYSNHHSFRNDHIAFYRVPWGSWQQVEATQQGEIAETAWVDPQSPIEGTTAGSLLRFGELYRGDPLSPYWGIRRS
ncbi:NUDIX domain-containing protein [Hyphomonas sp.]|uniref:NUDIX domain-containing protein n=1 Tax=Hyphomonas sp. TaxID=87 RepID=UPI00391CCD77